MPSRAALATTVLILLTGSAAATEYFVAADGDDRHTGTAGSPWKTLQKAAEAALAGDVVTVEDGHYQGFICEQHSGGPGRPIVFRARHLWKAVIDSPIRGRNIVDGIDFTDGILIYGQSYVIIDGFEVTRAGWRGVDVRSPHDVTGMDTRDNVVRNCHTHDNGLELIAPGRIAGHDGIFSAFAYRLRVEGNVSDHNTEHGIYLSNSADEPVVVNNLVHDNSANGIQLNADVSEGGDGVISGWRIEANVVFGNHGSAALNLDGAVGGVVQNNLIYDNDKAGITLYRGDAAEASHDNLVVNNTVFNPSGTRAALQIANDADGNVVFNNILYSGAGAGLEIQTVRNLMHDHNFVSTYAGGAAAAHESRPAPAVLFADAAGADFTAPPGSPAIGSGVTSFGGRAAPDFDIRGYRRPPGQAIDRGAYQSGAQPPSDAGMAGGGDGGDTLADAGTPPADASEDGDVAADGGTGGHAGGCGCRQTVGPAPAETALVMGGTLIASAFAYLVARRRAARRRRAASRQDS